MEFSQFNSQIGRLLRDVTDCMAAIFRPVAEQSGLTAIQVRALLQVRHGSFTVGGLSRCTGIARANASSMCKRLEQLGYLARVRDERDERVVRLMLTPAGRRLTDRIERDLEERLSPLLQANPQSLRAVLEGLETFSELLHQACCGPRPKDKEM